MNVNLGVNVGSLELRNPVMPASGCFGYGKEYAEYYSLNQLGAVVVSGTTLEPRLGNKTPRVTEVTAGMLNAIGLANPGIDAVIQDELQWLAKQDVPIIVNVSGDSVEDYCRVVEKVCASGLAQAIELNVSCPNVALGGIAFGVDKKVLRNLVESVKAHCTLPLIVKLSPNVTRIQDLAVAAAEGGADALSLINTLIGMQIDLKARKPVLANRTGGFSGRAIKPVAVRMLHDVAKEVDLPLIGMGGIYSGKDAIEFVMVGASAIMVGTANFTDPFACPNIIKEIAEWMEREGIRNLEEIRGCAL